jgi:ADP-ribosyl-[dinitrogen reductase] hydrolase
MQHLNPVQGKDPDLLPVMAESNQVEGAVKKPDPVRSGGAFADYQGPLWLFVEEKVRNAYDQGLSVLEAAKEWYSGAYLLETIPSVIYILMRHGHNLEEAIIRAVNDTKDNDTIAAIVGAAVGALHGKKAIPKRWIRDLSSRTTDRDGGRIFELLNEAKSLWWD